MAARTPLGVPFFDDAFGGIYAGRSVLVSGSSGSGKSTMAMQFLAAGLRMNQRTLMLSAQLAQDMAIRGDVLGYNFTEAVEAGTLVLLEYGNFIPGRDREENLMLPSQGFEQFLDILEEQSIQRLALDTVLPWTTLAPENRMAEHIFSFVRSFERMGVTSLFTVPRPVSLKAVKLFRQIENSVPVSISLLHDAEQSTRSLMVNKYVGRDQMGEEIPYVLRTPGGLVAEGSAVASPAAAAEDEPSAMALDSLPFPEPEASRATVAPPPPPPPTPATEPVSQKAPKEPEKRRIDFSSIVFGGR